MATPALAVYGDGRVFQRADDGSSPGRPPAYTVARVEPLAVARFAAAAEKREVVDRDHGLRRADRERPGHDHDRAARCARATHRPCLRLRPPVRATGLTGPQRRARSELAEVVADGGRPGRRRRTVPVHSRPGPGRRAPVPGRRTGTRASSGLAPTWPDSSSRRRSPISGWPAGPWPDPTPSARTPRPGTTRTRAGPTRAGSASSPWCRDCPACRAVRAEARVRKPTPRGRIGPVDGRPGCSRWSPCFPGPRAAPRSRSPHRGSEPISFQEAAATASYLA